MYDHRSSIDSLTTNSKTNLRRIQKTASLRSNKHGVYLQMAVIDVESANCFLTEACVTASIQYANNTIQLAIPQKICCLRVCKIKIE